MFFTITTQDSATGWTLLNGGHAYSYSGDTSIITPHAGGGGGPRVYVFFPEPLAGVRYVRVLPRLASMSMSSAFAFSTKPTWGRGGGVRLTGGDWDPLVGSPGHDLSGGAAHYSACYCPWGTLDATLGRCRLGMVGATPVGAPPAVDVASAVYVAFDGGAHADLDVATAGSVSRTANGNSGSWDAAAWSAA